MPYVITTGSTEETPMKSPSAAATSRGIPPARGAERQAGPAPASLKADGLPPRCRSTANETAAGAAFAERTGKLLAMALVQLALVGCGVSAKTACYTAVSATVTMVDAGMTTAGDLYRAGKLSEQAKDKLVASHDVYRPIAKAANAGCKVIGTSDEEAMQKLIKQAADAAAPLIRLLVGAGVTP